MPQERGFPSNSQKRGRSRSRSRSPPRKRPGATARTNRDRRPPPGPDKPRSNARDPSPPRSPSRSPPRQLKRPGGAARISQAEREAARRRQEERDRELERERQAAAAARGVGDVVKQHYNAVPERGREWRKTDSKIKGLRSFNNWVKSCIIQKFSPGDESMGEARYGDNILVLDIGCGKGGDLQKWQSAPRRVDLYVGIDPADVSIDQARGRYEQMKRRPNRGRPQHVFHAEFFAKDGYGEWLGDIPIIREVGIDPSVGPDSGGGGRFGGGGFDVVTMMFCMHYAFESEQKARGMLRNVAGSLKKGGRFIGVIPNSDVLSAKVEEFHAKNGKGEATADGADGSDSPAYASDEDWDPEKPAEEPKEEAPPPEKDGEVPQEESVEWGNSIYRVKFPGKTPADGVFRPPFGWKYFYFLEEAVESVPEYVVPWEAFRALAEDYNLELQYRKPFNEVWDDENGDPTLGPLSERMGVRGRDRGPLLIKDEEMEAASFYHAFCFYKV